MGRRSPDGRLCAEIVGNDSVLTVVNNKLIAANLDKLQSSRSPLFMITKGSGALSGKAAKSEPGSSFKSISGGERLAAIIGPHLDAIAAKPLAQKLAELWTWIEMPDDPDEEVGRLAGVTSERGSIVAAAGCGKTEQITRAVSFSDCRRLILTHTHACVDAMAERLSFRRVPPDKYRVDTIAGWCSGSLPHSQRRQASPPLCPPRPPSGTLSMKRLPN